MKIGGGVIMGIQMNENFNWAHFLDQTNRQKVYVILGSVLIFGYPKRHYMIIHNMWPQIKVLSQNTVMKCQKQLCPLFCTKKKSQTSCNIFQ